MQNNTNNGILLYVEFKARNVSDLHGQGQVRERRPHQVLLPERRVVPRRRPFLCSRLFKTWGSRRHRCHPAGITRRDVPADKGELYRGLQEGGSHNCLHLRWESPKAVWHGGWSCLVQRPKGQKVYWKRPQKQRDAETAQKDQDRGVPWPSGPLQWKDKWPHQGRTAQEDSSKKKEQEFKEFFEQREEEEKIMSNENNENLADNFSLANNFL